MRPTHPPRTARLGRRGLMTAGLALPALAATACSDPVPVSSGAQAEGADPSDSGGEDSGVLDTSGSQEPVHTDADPDLAAAVPEAIRERGSIIVGTDNTGSPPLSFLADDNQTTIGAEVDIARLAAEKLDLELDLKITTWENWPLKLEAEEFDVVHSNVGINAERLEKFDFASYRAAFMAFLAAEDAEFQLEDAASISGRIIAVGNATNQEAILASWNEELEEAGEEPAELKNYSAEADVLLALGSGRIDAYFAPFATVSYIEATRDDVEVQGKVDAGWPDQTLVAATFLHDSGLVEVYADALQATIDDGSYAEVLDRWGLAEEALDESRPHTKENP